MSRIGLLILLLLFCSSVFAQSPTTIHIFPQVADGTFSDGTAYGSYLWVQNTGAGSASCTITAYGVSANRFSTTSFTVPSGAWMMDPTTRTGTFSQGYGRLSCTQPVTASMNYAYLSRTGVTQGMATVFSAPPIGYAMIPMVIGVPLKFGIAIANDNASAISVSLLFTGNTGAAVGQVLSIPGHSQYVKFVDQIVTLPSASSPTPGTLELVSSSKFSVTGLLYDGAVFTTIVPATLP